MGGPADFQAMLDFLNLHQVVPVVDEIFPLADAEKAINKMAGLSQFGKIVLTT